MVTSDSDFAYLCRKLRERGATVYIVGEEKTPEALHNASDQFFQWARPESPKPPASESVQTGPETAQITPKRRPLLVVEAVKLLASNSPEGKVHLSGLGQYLKRTDPAFSPQTYGHSGLLNMLRTYDLLIVQQENEGGWTVRLAPSAELALEPSNGSPPIRPL